MEWESEQENVKEPVDYMKRVIYAIPVCIVLMMIVMAVMHEDEHYNSRVNINHILVKVGETAEEKVTALEKVSDIKRQLDEGASFKKMAAQYSDDDTNRDKGGELGWFERGETVEAFDAYIWVGEVGGVSDPIETIFGYHLIYILDREISDSELYQINLNERFNERMNQKNKSGQ
jgi:foldase protein PrsA